MITSLQKFDMLDESSATAIELERDFIRDTLGRDKVDIVVKNDIDSHVLDRLVVAGEYTVPRWEAYTILCADKRIEDDKKEMATPTSEEDDAAVVV